MLQSIKRITKSIRNTTVIILLIFRPFSQAFSQETSTAWDMNENFTYENLKNYMLISPAGREKWNIGENIHFKPYDYQLIDKNTEEYLALVPIINRSDQNIKLRISTFFLDYVDIYQISDKDTLKLPGANGYLIPVSERAFNYFQTSIIPLEVPANSEFKYLFHIRNPTTSGKALMRQSFKMGFIAYSISGFQKWYERGERFHFFLLGIVGLLAIINISIFIWGRDKTYLFISLYNISFAQWIILYGGFLLYFGIVDNLILERTMRQSLVTTSVSFSYAWFGYYFLNLKENAPKLGVITLVVACVQFSMLFLYASNHSELAIAINSFVSPILHLLMLSCGIVAIRKKQPFAPFFTLGTILIIIAVAGILIAFHSDEINYLTGHYLVLVCLMIDSMIFTFITSGKFILFQQTKLKLETQKQILENELSTKNRQLTTFIAEQIKRNSAIDNLKGKMISNGESSLNTTVLEKDFNQIKNENANWETFKTYFENVYPNYLEKLYQLNSNLTNNDLRMCAFIKMGLKTKEIATINGVSVRAIEKAKERLKKKLNAENLNDSLISII